MRKAVERLRHPSGSAVLVVLAIALGSGSAAAFLGFADATVVRPLPIADARELVYVTRDPQGQQLLPATAADSIRSCGVLSSIAIVQAASALLPTADGSLTEPVRGFEVSAAYFDLYREPPLIGRYFTEHDLTSGTTVPIVLGETYWRARYGASIATAGQMIALEGRSAIILGVAPESVSSDRAFIRPTNPGRASVPARMVARVPSRMSIPIAEDKIQECLNRSGSSGEAYLNSLVEMTVRPRWQVALRLLAAAGALFLLVCANVTNLLVIRNLRRQDEFAIRRALGATRRQIVAEVLRDAVVLAACGGVLGVSVAWLTLKGLGSVLPVPVSAGRQIDLDSVVVFASVLVALFASVLVSALPALLSSRPNAADVLFSRERTRTPGATTARHAVVMVETAIAVCVVGVAMALVDSSRRIDAVDLGIDTAGVIAIRVQPHDPSNAAAFYDAVVGQLESLPFVHSVGTINALPLSGVYSRVGSEAVRPVGREAAAPPSSGWDIRHVSPGYFEVMRIRPQAGRLPVAADNVNSARLAVLNELAARLLFGDEPATGRHLLLSEEVVDVIGVVSNVRHSGPLQPSPAEVYLVQSGQDGKERTVVIRSAYPIAAAEPQIRKAAAQAGYRATISSVTSMDTLRRGFSKLPRDYAELMSVLGAIALLVGGVGVFSVVGNDIISKRREIWIRTALGASLPELFRAAAMKAILWSVAGVIAGVALLWFGRLWLRPVLFETTVTAAPVVGTTLVAVVLTIVGAVLTASGATVIRVWRTPEKERQ